MRDVPSIAASAYSSTVMPLNATGFVGDYGPIGTTGTCGPNGLFASDALLKSNSWENYMATIARRLVKVVIVDPNDNIPLDKCLLYSGEEKLTDATDQELFFEIDIKDLLAKHNEERVKLVDKKVKERTEYLEPAKIRDLKMVVVNIATF